MTLFLDSGDLKEIKKFCAMGIIRGVTTNPTILCHNGVCGGTEGIKKRAVDIAKFINPLPLSIELTTSDTDKMVDQAIKFSKWASNVIIKVPIHGPEGEENLRVIHELETKHDIRVNVTAMMSAQQCYIAALAGATYVSLFCGRVNNMGYNSVNEISKTRKILDDFNLKSRIICASTREVLNVIEWLSAGAHIVTVLPHLINGMMLHPYSKETVRQFMDDASRLQRKDACSKK